MQRTNINYLLKSDEMIRGVKKSMGKSNHESKPYEHTDHMINKAKTGGLIKHMTSENFLNRNKAPIRDQLQSEKVWLSKKNYKKVDNQPIGRIRKNLGESMIAGNLVRGEDIDIRPHVGGDKINITVPQDEHNKTIHEVNRADIVVTPYDKEKYTRTANLLQRNQSDLESANRTLMTQPFARHYLEKRRKGEKHLEAYKNTINQELDYHERKQHDLFNPYINESAHDLKNGHLRDEIMITQDIKSNGQPGQKITNLDKFDIEKLKRIAQMLNPQAGIERGKQIMTDISGVV